MERTGKPADVDRLLLDNLRHALSGIRFGSVTLVIQDGRVIQIDKSEKIRLVRQNHIDSSGI